MAVVCMLSLPGPYMCGIHAVLWWHIGTLMHGFAAEHRSAAGLLFPSRCLSGTILLTPYSMVWDCCGIRWCGKFLIFCIYSEWNLLSSLSWHLICFDLVMQLRKQYNNNNIIIYHKFLPPARKGSHVKSDNTHTSIKIHPLAHILDT